MTKNDWDAASNILDPLHRTYDELRPSFDEAFKNEVLSNKGFKSTWEERSISASRDASRMMFCDGHVLVEAGDPVWYAVPNHEDRDRFDLFIGHSALDRRNSTHDCTPGPDRGVRLTSARLSRAFGLGEMESTFRSLRGRTIRYRSEIIARQDLTPGPAAELCARAMAHHLWEIARWHPDLRIAMPAVAEAKGGPPNSLPCRQMIKQLASLQDTILNNNLSFLITDALEIVERLNALDGLGEEDDAALGALMV